jgi:hypothetical protein
MSKTIRHSALAAALFSAAVLALPAYAIEADADINAGEAEVEIERDGILRDGPLDRDVDIEVDRDDPDVYVEDDDPEIEAPSASVEIDRD